MYSPAATDETGTGATGSVDFATGAAGDGPGAGPMGGRAASALALLVAVAGLVAPAPAAAQEEAASDTLAADTAGADTAAVAYGECPRTLDGPAGASGVAWGDTLAALSRLAAELDAEPLPTAGAGRLVDRGDEAFAAGHHTVAYVAYAAAARAGEDDDDPGPLWKASRAAVDVGQDAGEDEAEAWYGRAEEWARQATDVAPDIPEGHLHLGQALGLVALDAGVRERVRLSEEIREEALATIEADSSYAGGWHVLGRWHKGVMELSGAGRFFARTFLGGEVLGEASWEKAARFLQRAAELEPGRIVHHLELATVHIERERPDDARASLEKVLSLPARDYHDCVYRAEARELLDGL